MITDYVSAMSYLEKGKDNTDRPLPGRATRLQTREAGRVAVCYHDTDVLTFCPDGTIVLDSGGWRTVTTKARINEYLPARWQVYQDNSIWYLTNGYWHDANRETYVFADGITLDPMTGRVQGQGEDPTETLKLKRSAAKFAKEYINALFAGKVPAPSPGDCWHCLMREVETGKPLGELARDSDHIVSHIEEGYYVPSLLVNAIDMFPVGTFIRSAVGEVWQGETVDGWPAEISTEQLTRSLKRYLYRQLGLAS